MLKRLCACSPTSSSQHHQLPRAASCRPRNCKQLQFVALAWRGGEAACAAHAGLSLKFVHLVWYFFLAWACLLQSAQLSPGQEIEARLRRDVTFGFALVGGSHKKKTSSTSLSALHRPARGARSRGSSASLAPPTPEGVYVRSVETGSPAHSAGLQVGLRVLALNGISVQDATMAECASLVSERARQTDGDRQSVRETDRDEECECVRV